MPAGLPSARRESGVAARVARSSLGRCPEDGGVGQGVSQRGDAAGGAAPAVAGPRAPSLARQPKAVAEPVPCGIVGARWAPEECESRFVPDACRGSLAAYAQLHSGDVVPFAAAWACVGEPAQRDWAAHGGRRSHLSVAHHRAAQGAALLPVPVEAELRTSRGVVAVTDAWSLELADGPAARGAHTDVQSAEASDARSSALPAQIPRRGILLPCPKRALGDSEGNPSGRDGSARGRGGGGRGNMAWAAPEADVYVVCLVNRREGEDKQVRVAPGSSYRPRDGVSMASLRLGASMPSRSLAGISWIGDFVEIIRANSGKIQLLSHPSTGAASAESSLSHYTSTRVPGPSWPI
ncbi:unnamed protein product [Prorocentrum cordatum]|uniref:Uncharacterized protein n=1 Tax=Prorocentrum cordatum TaxID=2364126 RepID=A0ABN9W094_9DINO|nr:unnamed protein product [Polarella glacialis]